MHFLEFAIWMLCIIGPISAVSVIEVEGCPKGSIYAHPKDCSKYMACNHGNSVEMNCPAGLLFDDKAGICNHAENVVCKKEPEEKPVLPDKPVVEPETPEIPNSKYCLTARGQFPHPKDCSKYYDCWDETVTINKCPNGLLFDAKKVHCEHADSAQCFKEPDHEEEKENPNEEKDEIPDKRFCLSSRGQFPHPTNCRKYYNCWDDTIVITECPVGTVFDPVNRFCVASESTACQVKRVNYRVANSGQKLALYLSLQRTVQDLADFDDDKYIKGVPIKGYKCPMARGQFAHETACRMYYNCWDEVVLLSKCPRGLLFDPVVRICDSPDRVNCQGKFIPGNNDDKPPKVKCNIDEGLMPKLGDCNKFYICHVGLGSEFTCPANLHFDIVSMACGYPGDVKCARSTTEKETETLPVNKDIIDMTKVGNKCEGRTDGIYETTVCGTFIKCVAGRTYPFTCPANLAYDHHTKRCEYRENVPKCNNA